MINILFIGIKIFTAFIVFILLNACSTTSLVIASKTQDVKYNFILIDERPQEENRTYFGSIGDIYACNYRVRLIKNKSIIPNRIDYLANQLYTLAPELLQAKKIIIKRFSVFINASASLSSAVVIDGILDGTINTVIGDISDDIDNKTTTAKNTIITDIDVANLPGKQQGCVKNYTGTYWSSELNGGCCPIVLYFEALIDDIPIAMRIVRPAYDKENIIDQIKSSFDAIVEKIIQKLSKN